MPSLQFTLRDSVTGRQASSDPELTVLSFGAGQDSSAILARIIRDPEYRAKWAPRNLIVVMSDTGDEHPATYENVEACRQRCHEAGIPFYFLQPSDGYHGEAWQTLRGQWRRNSTFGSKAYPKTCTWNLKIMPIYRFLEAHVASKYDLPCGSKRGLYAFKERFGPIRVILGIAGGEESRVGTTTKEPKWMRECIHKVYPLIEDGWDRARCQAYLHDSWGHVPPPSNCILCPFMSHQELLWLHRNLPGDYEDAVALETAKVARFKARGTPDEKNYGMFGRRLLPEALREAVERFGHWSDAQLNEYKQSHGHCVKSTY